MGNIRCICKKCGKAFIWTHEERIAGVEAFDVTEAMFDTKKFKIETDRMKKPEQCGGCRAKKGPKK